MTMRMHLDVNNVGEEDDESLHLVGGGNGQGRTKLKVIDRKFCCCTKWLTAKRCRTCVSYFRLCPSRARQFQCCGQLCILLHTGSCPTWNVLRIENVSVGRGCFELWHGECSVCVNVSLTVQSCVHTQIRRPAHTTMLLTEHILLTQIQWTAIQAWP